MACFLIHKEIRNQTLSTNPMPLRRKRNCIAILIYKRHRVCHQCGASQKGGFHKSCFLRMFLGTKNRNEGAKKRNDGPQKPEWGKNRKEGTKKRNDGTKTGTRVHLPKPPFYKTALLFPLEQWNIDAYWAFRGPAQTCHKVGAIYCSLLPNGCWRKCQLETEELGP